MVAIPLAKLGLSPVFTDPARFSPAFQIIRTLFGAGGIGATEQAVNRNSSRSAIVISNSSGFSTAFDFFDFPSFADAGFTIGSGELLLFEFEKYGTLIHNEVFFERQSGASRFVVTEIIFRSELCP